MQTNAPSTGSHRWANLLKLLVVILAMGLLIGTGKLQLSDLRVPYARVPILLVAPLLVFITILLSFCRYKLLLRAVGIELPFKTIHRIGWIGSFFNTFMPGGMGGDVIKLAYVMRESGKRSEVLASIMVDRLLGLAGVLSLGGIALILSWDEVLVTPPLHDVSLAVFGLIGAMGMGLLFGVTALARGRTTALIAWGLLLLLLGGLSGMALQGDPLALMGDAPVEALLRGRALLILAGCQLIALGPILILPSCEPGRRLERLLQNRIPGGRLLMRLIESLLLYRTHFTALGLSFLLSVFLQALALLALFVCAEALGHPDRPTLSHIFFAGPPVFIINVIPISPGGLGVGEGAFDQILGFCRTAAGHPVTRGVAIFLMYRCWLTLLGFIGLPYYLARRKDLKQLQQDGEHLLEGTAEV